MSTASRPGYYGAYGGRYVPETLVPALDELERGWREIAADDGFRRELDALAATYVGRPTPLYRTERLADDRTIYLKREDLCHTGAHKINNAVGQALVARRLGKHRIVAETGAGQHGVAAATVVKAARVALGLLPMAPPRGSAQSCRPPNTGSRSSPVITLK